MLGESNMTLPPLNRKTVLAALLSGASFVVAAVFGAVLPMGAYRNRRRARLERAQEAWPRGRTPSAPRSATRRLATMSR